jgi:hypothetical protein
MRRIVFAVLIAVVGSARFASAAAISVAGAECGTPPLLGLSFTAGSTGTNLTLIDTSTGSVACPTTDLGSFGFGAIVDEDTDTPLYGPNITSLDVMITGLTSDTTLEILNGFAFDTIDSLGNNLYRLSGGTGIHIQCSTIRVFCAPDDALILFDGFRDGASFMVTAVNPVPEPATGALILTGLSAALVRRRRRTKA